MNALPGVFSFLRVSRYILNTPLEEPGMDWEYFRFATFLSVKLEPHGNDECEVTVVVSVYLSSPYQCDTSTYMIAGE